MRGEDGEVDRPDPSGSAKVDNAGMSVIVEIRDQKQAGRADRSDHAHAMSADLAAVDEAMADKYQHTADGV